MIRLLQQIRHAAAERGATLEELAAVDRAIDRSTDAAHSSVPRRPHGLGARRREELLEMVARGDLRRAVVLCREHVVQYPDDAVIGVLLEILATSGIDDGDTTGGSLT